MAVKSIREIKEEFKQIPPEKLPEYMDLYRDDSRKGVQDFLKTQENRMKKYEAELVRIEELCSFEKKYSDYSYICGVDEVGRGPLAGPVVAGAVILPKDCRILYINDSKKLSAKKREELSAEIQEKALAVGIGLSTQDRIDEINIRRPLTRLCERPSPRCLWNRLFC